ncbi:MAG: PKD domain-containing protein [Candidatus Woesearchaeota archaeon]|jgi:hypothetical protein
MNKIRKAKTIKYTRKVFLVALFLFLALASVFTKADLNSDQVIIENISSYVVDSSIIIYWDTNILSDSLIQYGLSSDDLNETNYLGVHSFAHAAKLIGLIPNSSYYYVVNSTNANGNSNQSEILTFITPFDVVAPSYSTIIFSQASPAIFAKNKRYNFKSTWIDNNLVSVVILQNNFRSNLTNETMLRINSTNVFEYEFINLTPGEYSLKLSGVDLTGNINETMNYNYSISKATPLLNLSINNFEQNITLEQKSFINITGLLTDGDYGISVVVRNATSILNQSFASENISMVHFFDLPGLYNVTLNYNETQNYTSNSITYIINVTPIDLFLFLNKVAYNLSDIIEYTIVSSSGANVSAEICGPLPTGSGFVECKSLFAPQVKEYPYFDTIIFTNKTGTYKFRAQLNYKGISKYVEKNYTVSNNLQTEITGNIILRTGQESSIYASTTGGAGLLRYNWTLSNGTKIAGQNLNVKYNSAGTYPVVLTVIDDYGNYKTETLSLIVKKAYKIKVLVLDSANNGIIDSAKVKMESSQKTTDSDGIAEFDLIEGEYAMKVSATDYVSYAETIDSNVNKTLTIKLNKLQIDVNAFNGINLISPVDGTILNPSLVQFNADVNIGSSGGATCWFYVAEEGNDWYRVMNTVSVKNSGRITHTESFSDGKTYSWKVQCEVGSKIYNSKVWKFMVQSSQAQNDASLTILDGEDSSIIDAGEIRTKIESALTNIDVLDMESKKDADTLKFAASVDKALKDYDRAMRDINNLNYRRDLSATEQEAKKVEYFNSLTALESITPLNMRTLKSQTSISYPTKEELLNISKNYQQQKNIVGKDNQERLLELQNAVIVTTRAANVEIVYIDGTKKIITLITKTLKISDNSTDTFLLEYVPKFLANSADKVVSLSGDFKVIDSDPLLKFDKQTTVIYYVDGEKDVELAKSTKTIMMTDTIFGSKNSITGAVTFSDVEWTSPASLIILIIIISCTYLIYAFDVFGSVFAKSEKKIDEEKINKILSLIKDASDFVLRKELDSADLIFKEIKLLYESSTDDVKSEVYGAAVNLLESVDVAQIEMMMSVVEAANKTNLSDDEKERAKKMKDTLFRVKAILSDVLKEKYGGKIDSLISEESKISDCVNKI